MFHSISGGCQQKAAILPQFTPKPTNMEVTQKTENLQWSSQDSRLSYSSHSSLVTYNRSSGTAAYSSVQAAESIQQPAAEVSPNNPYSTAILSAIEAQLLRDQNDGASTEELQSRLLAGLDGFKQGYGQALDQLSAMAGFTPEIQEEIRQTHDQVLNGIAALADKYGLEAPAETVLANGEPQAAQAVTLPVSLVETVADAADLKQHLGRRVLSSALRDIKILEEFTKVRTQQSEVYGRQAGKMHQGGRTEEYGYGVSEQRSFDFNLKTQDGDLVTVKMSVGKAGLANFSSTKTGEGELVQRGQQYSNFEFSVVGELDEEELHSINELLVQAGDISEFFFSGDMDSAVQAAMGLDFDSSEIDTFDINWSKTVMERSLVDTVDSQPERPLIAGPAADHFLSKLDYAKQFTDTLGQPRSLVADLTEWVAQQTHPKHPWSQYAGDFVRSFV